MEVYGDMIDEIIQEHERLEKELRMALAVMERSDRVNEIHKEIIDNQKRCPHFSAQYNWAFIDGKCPYCGFQLKSEARGE